MMERTLTKEDYEILYQICRRAEHLGIERTDRITLMMDLSKATVTYNLDLPALLLSDNTNFTHDVWHIQGEIDRGSGKFTNCFLPRFARCEG